jgi:hypothetical protein
VDLSAFIYFPNPANAKPLSYLAAGVLPLGSSQIELRASKNCTEALAVIRAYKETNRADSSIIRKISSAVDLARNSIRIELHKQTNDLLINVRDLIPSSHNSRRRHTQFYRAQLLLGGGGLCQDPYKIAIKNAMADMEIVNPPIIPLPVPTDIIWPNGVRPDQAYSRLSVAYGLSFLKASLDAHRFPSEIKRYPTMRQVPSIDALPHAPTKDEV